MTSAEVMAFTVIMTGFFYISHLEKEDKTMNLMFRFLAFIMFWVIIAASGVSGNLAMLGFVTTIIPFIIYMYFKVFIGIGIGAWLNLRKSEDTREYED